MTEHCIFLRLSAALLALTILMEWPSALLAQSLSFSTDDEDKPITITAEQGLEWRQTEKRFIARGNAKAVQADISVAAEELTAHYREKAAVAPAPPEGQEEGGETAGDAAVNSNEIYRIDAIGKVIITSETDIATGDAAVYDFDRAVLVLEGDPVTLTTGDGTVTAHRTLQYWSKEKVAVAEGDAEATDADAALGRQLKADRLTAYFRETGTAASGSQGKTKRDITHIIGAGNIVLTTKSEVVRGDHASYNVDRGIAIVDGNVKMTRDNSQLNGGFAVVNLKSGISRLYGSAAEARVPGSVSPPRRVNALLAPRPRANDSETSVRKEP